jgi:hypothetical protein
MKVWVKVYIQWIDFFVTIINLASSACLVSRGQSIYFSCALFGLYLCTDSIFRLLSCKQIVIYS